MLLQLSIRNFALIDEMSLEFHRGFNVLTGETGAGKSILIDALRLVLGGRMETAGIRDRDKPCVIEAVFSLERQNKRLADIAVEYLREGDEFLVLKREVTGDGRSKNYVNRRLVNLSVLKDLGECLVDFHGQFDQQSVFLPAMHLAIVDRLAGLTTGAQEALLEDYRSDYHRYVDCLKQQQDLREAGENQQREVDLLTYQIREIEKVSPEEGEEEGLIQERIRLTHAQKLYELTSRILGLLNDDEHAASSRIGESGRSLLQWLKIDPSVQSLKEDLDAAEIRIEEFIHGVREYRENLTFDEDRLNGVGERLDQIDHLKRKYGKTIAEVLEFLAKAKADLDRRVNHDVYQRDLEKEMNEIEVRLAEKAGRVSRLRKKTGQALTSQVEKELRELGIAYARFECRIAKVPFDHHGCDRVEFFLSSNAGEEVKPLVRIASAGEASRILLALKRALAQVDDIPTLIFDEIDANIGGRLGEVVGRKVREMAAERQIFLITHLPQIASFACHHIKVVKRAERDRTRVHYQVLEGDEKVRELAHMMSGSRESRISHSHAREMLKVAGQ